MQRGNPTGYSNHYGLCYTLLYSCFLPFVVADDVYTIIDHAGTDWIPITYQTIQDASTQPMEHASYDVQAISTLLSGVEPIESMAETDPSDITRSRPSNQGD